MTASPNPVSFDEYMSRSYSPDCEYLDGLVSERNVGNGKHSFVQGRILLRLSEELGSKGIVLPEQRTQIAPERVRIPDVSVVVELEEITSKPPLLCVEVLSPDDRWNRMLASVSDYQGNGVPCVWVVDPYSLRAWIFELDKPPAEVADGRLTATALGVDIGLSNIMPA